MIGKSRPIESIRVACQNFKRIGIFLGYTRIKEHPTFILSDTCMTLIFFFHFWNIRAS